MRRLLPFLLLLGPVLAPAPAFAQGLDGPRVEARLVADRAVAAPGEPLRVGLHQDIAEGWHTYWRNPGDSGAATTLDLDLPEGATAGPIRWPAPEALAYAGLMNHGYEDEVLLVREIVLPEDWPTGIPLLVQAEATWLVCADVCIPESGSFELLVETGETTRPSAEAPLFAAAEAARPRPSPYPARFAAAAEDLRLAIEGDLPADVGAHFFPFEPGLIEAAAPQEPVRDGEGLALDLALAEGAEIPARLEGVLVLEGASPDGGTREALAIAASPGPVAAAPATDPLALLRTLGLALLGGLILNLMPCVFPVLSMKALHLVGHETGRRAAGFAYTGGVLTTFTLLGGLLVALRSGGTAVGWGFQLQEPLVVLGLAWLTAAVGLWLLTGLSLGTRFMGLGSSLGQSGGVRGSFLTGALAVIVATPCTAPFMAGAVGFALTRSATVALAVFLALGLGLALPFLLLSLVPALGRLLPRPGPWMERLRQALAFPMLATSAWLLWVLSLNAGSEALLAALLGLVVLGLAFWLVGLRGRIAHAAAFTALLLSLALPGVRLGTAAPAAAGTEPGVTIAPPAEPFTQARLEALRAAGRPVLVNITAAWCLTCLVNERVALDGKGFEDRLEAADAAYLKGDWTRQDPVLGRFLARFGRSGVPLYAVFPPRGAPEVLPQLLTPARVETALRRAADGALAGLDPGR